MKRRGEAELRQNDAGARQGTGMAGWPVRAMLMPFIAWTVLLLVGPADAQDQPINAPAVAVLEPEVVGDVSVEQRRSLAAAIDAMLLQRLGGRDDVSLVDRQSLDMVLAEHELEASGGEHANRLQPERVASPLRPFWSAGVLVVTEIDIDARVVVVEAVSAQSGMRLGGLYLQLERMDAEAVAKAVEAKLPGMWNDAREALVVAGDRPTVAVAADLSAGLERSRWLADDAAATVRARIVRAGHVTLLTPRRPLVTKEERLLRLMGLAVSHPDDVAAGLRASPDVTVRVSVAEQAMEGRPFDETPIRLRIELEGVDLARQDEFAGTAGTWEDQRAAMTAWLDEQLATMSEAVADDDDERARQVAARKMASIEPWVERLARERSTMPRSLQMRLNDVALHAAHLDPTNEMAAWVVAMTLMVHEEPRSYADRSEHYYRTVMLETQRYLDRFGDTHPERQAAVFDRLALTGRMRVSTTRRQDRVPHRYRGGQALLEEPCPHHYEVARRYVRALAQWTVLNLEDDRYGRNKHGRLVNLGHVVVADLVPHIPVDRLDDEYRWWKQFYAQNIQVLPEQQRYLQFGGVAAAPWELLAAAFAARQGDPAEVRRHLETVAAIYPADVHSIWGGDRNKQPIVPVLLKAAGDPEWERWEPPFGEPQQVTVTRERMLAFLHDLRAHTPPPWDDADMAALPGQELLVPESVRELAFREGDQRSQSVEAVLQTDDEVWFIAPGMFSTNLAVDVQLFVGRLADRDHSAPATLTTEAIPWPETGEIGRGPHWSYAHAIRHQGHWVVFMGTEGHGLLRLDKVDQRWQGRWIGAAQGLPFRRVDRIATVQHDGHPALLVIGRHEMRTTERARSVAMIATLSLEDDAVTLLHDGMRADERLSHPVAITPDDRRVLLELAGSPVYAEPLDVSDIVKLTSSGASPQRQLPLAYTRVGEMTDPSLRIWWPHWDSRHRRHNLFELDARTLAPVNDAVPGRGTTGGVSAAVDADRVRHLFNNVMSGSAALDHVRIDRWPNTGSVFTIGGGEVVWMTPPAGRFAGRTRTIVGYRPAPRDADDWAADDLWIGPFRTRRGELILGLREAQEPGTFLLSTTGHVMLLDEAELLAEAERAGAVRSTRQWREDYEARLSETGWQSLVPALMLDGRHDEALALLKSERDERPTHAREPRDRQAIAFWTARVLADTPDRLDDAIALYDRIATEPGVDGPAEAFARANQVVLLYRAERWAALLEIAELVAKRFPQAREGGPGWGIERYVDEARWKLAEARDGTAGSTDE